MTIDINILKTAAYTAGRILLEAYAGEYQTAFKEDASPVTSADVASQQAIVAQLKHAYPQIPIVAEEEGLSIDPSWTTYFLIDPLDGTKEFIAKTDEFAVLIAYVEKGDLHQAIVYAPVLKRMFYGHRGHGAFEFVDNHWKTLKVSDRVTNGTVLVSRFHKNKAFMDALEEQAGISVIRECGSALKGCLIAAGEAELYLRWGNTYKWDTAAMQLLVEEAGGMVTQVDGSPMVYDLNQLLNDKGIIVSNPHFGSQNLSPACKNGFNIKEIRRVNDVNTKREQNRNR